MKQLEIYQRQILMLLVALLFLSLTLRTCAAAMRATSQSALLEQTGEALP